jgi:lysophospholipase L1-like esterase
MKNTIKELNANNVYSIKYKNVLYNLLTLLISFILILYLIEIILSIYNPFPFRVKNNNIILPVNTKNTFYNDKIRNVDKKTVNKKNNLGFRGDQFPVNADSFIKIITIGGSTTECMYITEGKTWPDVLKLKLGEKNKNIWLNNAGLDGHSTFGHYILLKDYILKLKPDYVLLLIGCNEVGREDLTKFDLQHIKLNEIDENKLISLIKLNEIRSIYSNFTRYLRAKELNVIHKSIKLEAVPKVNVNYGQENRLYSLHRENYLKEFKERLLSIISLAKSNGIKVILITQPALYGDVVDDATKVNLGDVEVKNGINGRIQWNILELYNGITRSVGLEENLLVIDLAKKMPKSSNYFYDWHHFTNDGCDKVAEIIFAEMNDYLTKNTQQNSSK